MPVARYSRLAEADLLAIGTYSLETWGIEQTVNYLGELEACCQQLADTPAMGRICDYVRAELQRFDHGRHVVFYRQEPGGILVSRILHQSMLPERHEVDDD